LLAISGWNRSHQYQFMMVTNPFPPNAFLRL
jgi:hypothetical protein